MMKFSKSGAALAVALALAASGAGAAVSLSDATTSGGSVILWSEAGGILTPTPSLSPAPAAALAGVLAGSAAAPGGNVELSKFAGPVTTLRGTLGGSTISLSSLTVNDWFVGGNAATPTALTSSYIRAAYSATHAGAAISDADLQAATMGFFGAAGQSPYKLVSDPNISYVMLDGADVRIGLAGFLNAQAALQAILGPGIVVPANAYASEVVKVEYAGVSQYLYSFAQPTASGVTAGDPNGSYTGNYEVGFKVPEPASLALASLGLAGIAALRRRRG